MANPPAKFALTEAVRPGRRLSGSKAQLLRWEFKGKRHGVKKRRGRRGEGVLLDVDRFKLSKALWISKKTAKAL